VARDAAGNIATSASVSVTVSNVTVPPAPASGWPNEPTGFTTLTDWGFDQAPPTSGDQPIGNGWRMIYNAEPGRPTGWVTLASDSTAPLSPSNVYDFVYPQGMQEGNAPATAYLPFTEKKEVYAGFYWKTSNPFDTGPAGNKIAFFFNGGGGRGGQQFIALDATGYLIVLPEYPEYAASGNYVVLKPNVTATLVARGVWHRIEWYSNASTGVVKWWLDGVLQGNYTGPAHNTYPFDMFQFSPTFGGCCSARKAQTDHYWFDHAHISAR
jgi:hypothetical protein